MISTAYYGLFCIGEITFSDHVVRARNVHIGLNKNEMMFVLKSSKTHDKGCKPQVIKISEVKKTKSQKLESRIFSQNRIPKHPQFCPFAFLKHYVTLRKTENSESEPFFVFRDRSPIMAAQFRVTLSAALSCAGMDKNLYTSHGLRAGRACQLLEMGVPIETIKKLGRWKSNEVYTYFSY